MTRLHFIAVDSMVKAPMKRWLPRSHMLDETGVGHSGGGRISPHITLGETFASWSALYALSTKQFLHPG